MNLLLKVFTSFLLLALGLNQSYAQTKEQNIKPKQEEILISEGASTGEEEIFIFTEQMPSFPGGETELNLFINKNLRYPKLGAEHCIEGKVIVRFVVCKDGTLKKAEVLKKMGWGFDEEALRIVGIMPNWIPAKNNGQKVDCYILLPIKFKLP
ncbi:MAG: hypothetical protein CFE21_13190 [Bacteroidetes bacterium B1(2017)]|nr:MAG: hypothetical protein CFE21_13190 [Bacteroidetes bacterium B1(2017)]